MAKQAPDVTVHNMREIPQISIEKLISIYSAILLDAYGVLVDADGALPGAVELIERLNRVKKPYFILTNDASKLPETSAANFQHFGLQIEADRIITSGMLLKDYFEATNLVGARCIVLGPEDSFRYVERAGGQIVSCSETFDALVLADEAGYPFLETVDDVLTALFHKLDRQEKIHLILPNPDLIYPKTDHGFGIASGSVALMIEAALQIRCRNSEKLRFERLGKPYAAIFKTAQHHSGTRNMVIIGDQIETDIRGANGFGIDSVLIETGISQTNTADLPQVLQPTYRMSKL